jgi:hypothetical protein
MSTAGPLITRPGFGGIEISIDGTLTILPNNRDLRVPSVVSKGNIPSNALYTYNKRVSGWYLTAIDPRDPRRPRWSVQVGSGGEQIGNQKDRTSMGI